MVDNVNASKTASTAEYVDIRKFIGVASISIEAINPNNEKLRQYGWTIPEDADEPKYVTVNNEGKKSARIRFLVKIEDLDDKPVIALDYWVRPEVWVNKEGTKAQIIDSYGRTAWGTKAEIKNHQIPQYKDGPASISSNYKYAHPGEEDLVKFLMKFLNVTPLTMMDRKSGQWVPTKNPGHLTIDHWDKLCSGDVSEIAEYIALKPDNKVKVCLGIRTTEDNKSYQTFLSGCYIGNGALPDRQLGDYDAARKAIVRARNDAEKVQRAFPFQFSSSPVKEWGVEATNVEDHSGDAPTGAAPVPPVNDPSYFQTQDDDLPFGGPVMDPNEPF